MVEHVFNDLENTQPFLRIRALQMYSQFCEHLKFKEEGHLKKVVELTYRCLCTDKDLPVRFYAATSINKFLNIKEAETLLKPHLKAVLESFLQLMNEIESEELVSALEEIVSMFRDDIDPFAI